MANITGTQITELITKELGFIDEALRINDNLFFYKHPDGSVHLAYDEYDIVDNIQTLERLSGLYYFLTEKKLVRKIFS